MAYSKPKMPAFGKPGAKMPPTKGKPAAPAKPGAKMPPAKMFRGMPKGR